jgi:hypothetical protein
MHTTRLSFTTHQHVLNAISKKRVLKSIMDTPLTANTAEVTRVNTVPKLLCDGMLRASPSVRVELSPCWGYVFSRLNTDLAQCYCEFTQEKSVLSTSFSESQPGLSKCESHLPHRRPQHGLCTCMLSTFTVYTPGSVVNDLNTDFST